MNSHFVCHTLEKQRIISMLAYDPVWLVEVQVFFHWQEDKCCSDDLLVLLCILAEENKASLSVIG